MHKSTREHGAALLLALGLLAMLMVIGVAFVSNALISKKIGENSYSRALAMLVAQSAVSRVQASCMLYQYRNDNKHVLDSFDGIYSYDNDRDPTKKKLSDDGAYTDLLTGENSRLKLPADGVKNFFDPNQLKAYNDLFTSDTWPGRWVYFFDQHNRNRIIGRAAWQVISSNKAQMLAHVFLSGHINDEGWIPNVHGRWGKDIDEAAPQEIAGGVFSEVKSAYTSLEDLTITDWETTFTKLSISDNNKKSWIKKWLAVDEEGTSANNPTEIIPETYIYKNGKHETEYHRFNISNLEKDGDPPYRRYFNPVVACTDPWYARLSLGDGDTNRNGEIAIKRLTKQSVEYKDGDSEDCNLEQYGIPFLRRIGHVSGGFMKDNGAGTKIDDLAALRKQIAANFNDYCDKDDIPTSNIPAAEWSIDDETKFPSYTGNEKTLYVNEFGFNFKDLKFKLLPGSSGLLSGKKVIFAVGDTSTIKGEFIAELINIYKDYTPVIEEYKLKTKIKKLEFRIKPTLYFKVKFSFKYKTSEDAEATKTLDESIAIDKDDFDNSISLTLNNLEIEIDTFRSKTNSNYFLGEKEFEFNIPTTNSLDFGNKLLEKLEKIAKDKVENFSSITSVDEIKVDKVEEVDEEESWKIEFIDEGTDKSELEMAPILLTRKVGTAPECGVDFVRTDRTAFKIPKFGYQKAFNGSDPLGATPYTGGHYLGGFEVMDPRANLNIHIDDNNKSTDRSEWYIAPEWSCDHSVMSIEESEGNLYGKVNTLGKPGEPKKADGTPIDKFLDCDTETVMDPAANGSNCISTAFIRNAPMESPWEIGLIHRGTPWQTINITGSGDADNPSEELKISSYAPLGESEEDWAKSGTNYKYGDGGILDQIKCTEYSLSYGKINVNLLNKGASNFNSTLDPEIVKSLFVNLRLGQSIDNFYKRSTSTGGSYPLTPADDGTPVLSSNAKLNSAAENFCMTTDRKDFESRGQFLNFGDDLLGLYNGFGLFDVSELTTDAKMEEIVGKTIGLLTAAPTLPNQIQIVIVAQSIEDREGTQMLRNSEGNIEKKTDCKLGVFDAVINDSGDEDKNYYFDRITGETKMLVTINRDPKTGSMRVRRIDYIE